jgi:hypothetical protein
MKSHLMGVVDVVMQAIPRSVSMMPSSTSSSAASPHPTHSSLQAADSFEEGLIEDDEEDEESERDGEEEEEEEGTGRALHLEGQLEKKSPAHNLWQARWFKIVTRVENSDAGGPHELCYAHIPRSISS